MGFCEATASFARMILICISADGSDTLIFLLMATPPMDHDIHNPFSGSDSPVCENFGSLKGMYRVIKRNRFIFLNNSLDENMLRIVCAHELGHDQLHRNMAKTTPIHEFMLYDMKSKPEYEANIVAAEILMDSDEVLRNIYEYGYPAE